MFNSIWWHFSRFELVAKSRDTAPVSSSLPPALDVILCLQGRLLAVPQDGQAIEEIERGERNGKKLEEAELRLD